MLHSLITRIFVCVALLTSFMSYAQMTPEIPFSLDPPPTGNSSDYPRSKPYIPLHGVRGVNSITLFCDYDELCTILIEQSDGEIITVESVNLKSGYTIYLSSGTEDVVIIIELLGKQYIARL